MKNQYIQSAMRLAEDNFLHFKHQLRGEEVPLDTLRKFPWELTQEPNHPKMRRQMTANLVYSTHLGRIAMCCKIFEHCHADIPFQVAEIVKHMHWERSINRRNENIETAAPLEQSITNLLEMEDPVLLFWVGGAQFNPDYPEDLRGEVLYHEVKPFQAWQAISASMQLASASLISDPWQRLEHLSQAEKVCPGMFGVRFLRAQTLFEMNESVHARRILLDLIEARPCARALFLFREISDNDSPGIRIYGEWLWRLICLHLAREKSTTMNSVNPFFSQSLHLQPATA